MKKHRWTRLVLLAIGATFIVVAVIAGIVVSVARQSASAGASSIYSILDPAGLSAELLATGDVERKRQILAVLFLSSAKITIEDVDNVWMAIRQGRLCEAEVRPLASRFVDEHREMFRQRWASAKAEDAILDEPDCAQFFRSLIEAVPDSVMDAGPLNNK